MNLPPNTSPKHIGSPGATAEFRHEPVMVELIVDLFGSTPPGLVLDATLGGAGHAVAILSEHSHLDLLGIDQDPAALTVATERLAPFGSRVTLRHARFDRISAMLETLDPTGPPARLSGALFDLGVSSPQFDWPERGFSYRNDGPLDMRMNPAQALSADTLVNHADESELSRILFKNADEKFARRIAKAIVKHRPITGTQQLAEIVRDAIPAPARRTGGHPAKRTFQALRIAVNNELEILPGAIDQAIDALVPGGICAVLTYHSGEDRIVKERFAQAESGGCTCPPKLPCSCGALHKVKLERRGGFTATADEISRNPRAASARLRVARRLVVDGRAA
jgi:16S rRNA (cytosine1402-N4)-methyltransferase